MVLQKSPVPPTVMNAVAPTKGQSDSPLTQSSCEHERHFPLQKQKAIVEHCNFYTQAALELAVVQYSRHFWNVHNDAIVMQ